jgi:hypothetical protein
MPVARFAVGAQRLDQRGPAIGGGRPVQWVRTRVPGVGEPSLARRDGTEIGQVSRVAVNLDRDLPSVAQRGAIDRGDSSGTEEDAGQTDAESGPQVPGEPVVDLVAVAGPEDCPLDAARLVVVDNRRGYAQVDRCSPPARAGCADKGQR